MASVGTVNVDLKVDMSAALKAGLGLYQPVTASGHRMVFVVASSQEMADWAASTLGVEDRYMVFVSTDNGLGDHALKGWEITMDDLVFAPGYRQGRCIEQVEAELGMVCRDFPYEQVVDFDDAR